LFITLLLLLNIVSAFMTATLIYDNKLDVAVAVMILTLMIDVFVDNDTSLTLILVYIASFTFFTGVYLIKAFNKLLSIMLK
jgi:hypothetical protein